MITLCKIDNCTHKANIDSGLCYKHFLIKKYGDNDGAYRFKNRRMSIYKRYIKRKEKLDDKYYPMNTKGHICEMGYKDCNIRGYCNGDC